MWRSDWMAEARPGYLVSTADRGEIHFWLGTDGPNSTVDRYGASWSWRGNLEVLDDHVSNGVITFPDYPNAFERIATGLECPTGGQVWLTARPVYEFTRQELSVHNDGGSHGSLHASDSLSPLILAGPPNGVTLPAHPRTVDLLPLCLEILDLEPERPVGTSHLKTKSS